MRRTRAQHTLALLMPAVILSSACSSSDESDSANASSSGQQSATHVACDDIGDGTKPPDGTYIDDIVAFPSLDEPALQVSPPPADTEIGGEGASTGDWLWAKRGLVVRSGHQVQIAAVGTDLIMGWGFGPITQADAVTVSCDADEEWLVIPGGYSVREPGCYSVDVSVDDAASTRVEIGIGAPCDGQQPPPSWAGPPAAPSG